MQFRILFLIGAAMLASLSTNSLHAYNADIVPAPLFGSQLER